LVREIPPFNEMDLVRYGFVEMCVTRCIRIQDDWFVEGEEIHTQQRVSTAAENCVFVDTAQINIFDKKI
jgi:hypothetical protein